MTITAESSGRLAGRSLPPAVGFRLLASVFVLLMSAVSAPSPLYTVYQERWHFSEVTLTAVFAIYALVLLVALLCTGALSDHLGRKPVILASVAIEIVALAVFVVADDVTALFVARALQGAATGLATSALSAGLIELQPDGERPLAPIVNSAAPTVGLATGALVTSLLVQYGPDPLRFVYLLLIAAFFICGAGVLAIAEPGTRRPGALASLRPRAGLPREARGPFLVALPCLVSIWALGGLYLSLGPSLAATLLHSSNALWGGIAIFLVCGTGAAASVLMRTTESREAMVDGCLALLSGLGLTVAGIAAASGALFLIGSAIAGFGFGSAFLGVFRSLSALAPPNQRASLIAVIYVVAYVSFSIPVVIAGIVANSSGLHSTSIVYAAALIALVAITLAALTLRKARPSPAQ